MEHLIKSNEIFVFGSNLAGKHGKGAAKTAFEKYGAKYQQGWGMHGQSYAIPTKDAAIKTLPLEEIRHHVQWFLTYANKNKDKQFFLTRIGCGLAGYTDKDISPMFREAPDNVRKPPGW